VRHPVPRQGSVFTPIIIFGLCLTVVGVIVAPTMAFDLVLRSGGLRPLLLAVPGDCPEFVKAVERANKIDQQELLNQILSAITNPIADPVTVAVHKFARTALGRPAATHAAVKQCASELIAHFPAATGFLLDTLEGKYGNLTVARQTPGGIYPAVVEGCKESPSCAKEIEIRYRNSKNPQTLEGLRAFLGDVGPSAAPALLAVIAETPHLGYGKFDSPFPLHEEISQLLDVAIKDESRRTSWLLFVQDKTKKSVLRWRIARLMRKMGILNQEPWLVMSELLQSPNLPLQERWDYHAAEAAVWTTIPEILGQMAADMNAETAKQWKAGKEQAELCVQISEAIDALRNSTLYPGTSEAATTGRQALISGISRFAEKTAATFGPTHALLDRLAIALESNPILSGPLPAVERFLASPASLKLGLRLLLAEPVASQESQRLFKAHAPRLLALPATRKILIDDLAHESDVAALRLLSLANSLDPRSRKMILTGVHAVQAKIANRLETEIQSQSTTPIEKVKSLSMLLTIKPRSPLAPKLGALINEGFACDEQWASAMNTIIGAGSDHPAFIPALFKLVSCPGEFADMNVLAPAIGTVQARAKIQAHLRSAKNLTPQQLGRLTEAFGQTNRIPGSAMPPKIKKPAN
jgi:hypothetical protein